MFEINNRVLDSYLQKEGTIIGIDNCFGYPIEVKFDDTEIEDATYTKDGYFYTYSNRGDDYESNRKITKI